MLIDRFLIQSLYEAFSCNRWQLTQRSPLGQCLESQIFGNTQSSMGYLHPNLSLQGSESYLEDEEDRLLKPEGKDNSKGTVSFRHNRTNAHKNSQRMWQHEHSLHRLMLDEVSVLRRKWALAFTSRQEATNDICLQKKNQYSSMECHCVY